MNNVGMDMRYMILVCELIFVECVLRNRRVESECVAHICTALEGAAKQYLF